MQQNSDTARERTELAKERTLLAYWRTALAFAGAGVLVIKLFATMHAAIIGGIVLVFGSILFLYGTRRFASVFKKSR